MATTTLTMAMASPCIAHKKSLIGSTTIQPLSNFTKTNIKSVGRIAAGASSSPSINEHAVADITAAALAAALVIPDIAEAAQPGVSPSLKNFLLSIVSGGVVLAVIVGAVVAVANFDPVKRS